MDFAMTVLDELQLQYRLTPADLLDLESHGLFELVDGRLIEKQMSSLAGKTTVRIAASLFDFLKQSPLGEAYSEITFQCFPNDAGLVRRPDLAFVSKDRLSLVPEEGHVPIAPDLVVEVISPNDTVYALDEKLEDYRSAGVKLAWVVNPHARSIRVFRLDGTITRLRADDLLTGESVLPGFSTRVNDLLPQARASRGTTDGGKDGGASSAD